MGSSLSVLGYVQLGSSLSLRSFARIGSALSVVGFAHIGSSMSIRSMGRFGSCLSMFGAARIGSSLSVLGFAHLGSTLSVRSFARFGSAQSVFGVGRFGSSVSVFDFLHLGSALSLRSVARIGSSFSVWSTMRLGSSMSVFDFGYLGSALSLRAFGRLGSSLSVCGGVRLGSCLSVLDSVNLGSVLSVSEMITTDKIKHVDGNTYLTITSTNMEFWAGGQRSMTIEGDGGVLHGAWSSDATVTTSDRRLKRNIEPLYRTIAQQAMGRSAPQTTPDGRPEQPISWLLRELRPVSFNLKHGPEAKHLKFGFIAQELETVFPNLVRTVGKDDTKSVASQDLIAVLTLALQTLQKEFDETRRELEEWKHRIALLEQVVYANQASLHV